MRTIDPNICAIIPVRDRPRLLRKAITSVLAQSVLPGELIIAVDQSTLAGSNDAEAAESLRVQAEAAGTRFELIAAGGHGPAAARNQAAGLSRAHWLAFLDSDDRWAAEKLEKQRDFLKRRPHLVACQTSETWTRHGKLIAQPQRLAPRGGRFLRDSFRTCLISCSSLMIARTTFEELGGFDESYPVCEDFELWLRLLIRHPVGLVAERLTHKHSGDWPQLSRTTPAPDYHRVRAILGILKNFELSTPERAAAEKACLEKMAILNKGARRHDSEEKMAELAAEVAHLLAPRAP